MSKDRKDTPAWKKIRKPVAPPGKVMKDKKTYDRKNLPDPEEELDEPET